MAIVAKYQYNVPGTKKRKRFGSNLGKTRRCNYKNYLNIKWVHYTFSQILFKICHSLSS